MLNDIFVLNRIREGDIKAFESLFRQYYTPLCLYAAGITGQMEAAEEIVEELFYVFWREREKREIFYSIKSYLYGAVRNQALLYCEHKEVKARYRDEVLSNSTEESSSDPQQQIEFKELQLLINRTLQKLPERRLRIFRLHRIEGKKYTEIALILSLSVKTIEAEMTKALKVLRNEVENYIQTR